MPAQVIGGAPGELPLMARFDFPGGRHRLRFTSLTASGEVIDRWVQNQVVPDFSKQSLVLSTPRVLRARNMIEFRAIESNPTASPTASTRLAVTDRVLIDIEYQSVGQTPQIKVDLLNAKGDLLQTLATPPPADGRLRMLLPVASLAQSTYVLRIGGDGGRRDRAAVARVPRRAIKNRHSVAKGMGEFASLLAGPLAVGLLAVGGAIMAGQHGAGIAAVAPAGVAARTARRGHQFGIYARSLPGARRGRVRRSACTGR